MQKRVQENLMYALKEDGTRFGKPVILLCTLGVLTITALFLFQRIDEELSSVEVKGYEHAKEHYTEKEAAVAQESKTPHISIAKIGVLAPITFVQSTDPNDFREPLKNGVTHYPSALPGEKGVSIILGHSAPIGWFRDDADRVFSNLKDLTVGDEILIENDNKVYRYAVEGQVFLKRGQEIPEEIMNADEARLVLLSCWPPGIDNKRIMVQAIAI